LAVCGGHSCALLLVLLLRVLLLQLHPYPLWGGTRCTSMLLVQHAEAHKRQ
jgi:hypothetical protein